MSDERPSEAALQERWEGLTRPKLTIPAVRAIRRLSRDGFSIFVLSREFGVSEHTISMIRARRMYGWVPDEPQPADQEPAHAAHTS